MKEIVYRNYGTGGRTTHMLLFGYSDHSKEIFRFDFRPSIDGFVGLVGAWRVKYKEPLKP